MNLVETRLPADLIRQVGYFVVDIEAIILKVSALRQHIMSRYRFRLELPYVQHRYISSYSALNHILAFDDCFLI